MGRASRRLSEVSGEAREGFRLTDSMSVEVASINFCTMPRPNFVPLVEVFRRSMSSSSIGIGSCSITTLTRHYDVNIVAQRIGESATYSLKFTHYLLYASCGARLVQSLSNR